MQPYGGYAQQSPFGAPPPVGQPPAGGGMQPPGGGPAVRSSPFGAPGAAPPTAPFGSAPPMAGAAPPTAPFPGAPAGGPPPITHVPRERAAGAGVPGPPTGPFGGAGGGVQPPPMGGPPMGVSAPPTGSAGNRSGAAPGYYPPGAAEQQAQGAAANTAAFEKDAEMCNSPPHFLRSTLGKYPSSASAKAKTNIPLGIVIQPLAPVTPGMEEVPTVNLGAIGTIVRCKSCRTYINPFITWEANGRRWTCNLCGFSQLTLDAYFASLDDQGKRVDRFQRPELSKGAVEYVAPGEYMVRPPQPPVFMFAIDVSYTAVVTGMLDVVVSTIKETIQSGNLPGGQRAQIGIITYDTAVHFYNLSADLSQPHMLVVSDLEDMFLPLPQDILVHVSENEAAIMQLLDMLPNIFSDTKTNESCMGSAVKAAFMATKHIGGKLLVFGANIPSVGELALKSTRDNPRILGSDKEVELLRPVNEGFKDLSTELCRAQISVELFLAPQSYVDLASIAPLAKYTGGDVRYYPQFHIQKDGLKLKTELMHVLTRYMGWEAVMRVRVSRGWKITRFYGHLFIRGADLLVVPNCHSDQTFAVQIDMEENVTPDPIMCVQSALLYTNSEGERRIRVHTWAATTTQNFNDMINTVDVQATSVMLSQIAIEHSLQTTLAEGRNKLHTQCQQIVQAGNMCPNSEAMQFLPLYIMGMLKSAAFRATADIPADMRTWVWQRLETLSVSQVSAFFYPRMMALHNLTDDVGVADNDGGITLPPMLNLTSESMSQDGAFLLEDGETMLIWVGRQVDPGFLQSAFGESQYDQIDPVGAAETVGTRGDPLSNKLGAIIGAVRAERSVPWMNLLVLRQGDPREMRFFASLIEDRTNGMQSTYTEFLQQKGYRPQAQAAPQQQAMGGAHPMGGAPSMMGGAPPMMGGAPPMGGGAPPMGGGAPPMGGMPPMGGPPMGGMR